MVILELKWNKCYIKPEEKHMSFKSLSLSFNHLSERWYRITKPLDSIQEQEARQKAHLVASLMLLIAILSLIGGLLTPIIRGEDFWPHPQFIGGLASAAFLTWLFRLSRSGHYDLAGIVATICSSVVLIVIAVSIGNDNGLYILYSLMVIVIFCGLFLSLKITTAVVAAHCATMLLLPSFVPGITLRAIINGPLLSYIFMSVFSLIVANHRRRFDAEYQKRLKVSEERYRVVSELISDYAFSSLVYPDGSYIPEWLTESFTRFTGYTADDVFNFPDRAILYHPDDSQRALNDMARLLKGETVDAEYRILTKDGDLRWARIYRQPIWDSRQGRVVRFYGIAQNITERKRAEAALAEERNLLRTLIDNLPDQVFVKDQQSRFVIANIATARHLGFSSPEMLVGRTDFDLNMPSENARQHFEDEQALMRSAENPLTVEFTAHNWDGDEAWYLSTKTPLRGRSGEVVGLVGINRNVTEIKRAEAQRHGMEMERERLAMVNRFTMAVSHDFRTSLTVIETNRYLAQRLLSPKDQDKIQPKLNKIHESVIRLSDQIQNLNTLSSLANPQTELCNLNSVMGYILDEHRKQASAKNIEIFFQSDSALPLTMADEEEIRSALKHLFVNALNYTPPGGKIMLRTYQSDQFVSAEVRDSGPGIDPKDQERIFDLFYRADSERGIARGGVGLGLSIVRMVAEAHGGNIHVESEPGHGSVFTLSLPVSRSA
jgi:PAS domain S-box-containing protein